MNITAWEKQLGLLWSLPRLAWFIIRALFVRRELESARKAYVIQELIHQRTESEHSSQISARLTSKKESSSHSSSLSRRLSFRQTNTRFLLTPSSHSFLPLLNRKNSHSKVLTRDSPFLEVSRIGHIVSQSFNRNKISETSEGSQLVVAIHASCFLGRLIANMHTSLLTKDVPGSSWHTTKSRKIEHFPCACSGQWSDFPQDRSTIFHPSSKKSTLCSVALRCFQRLIAN